MRDSKDVVAVSIQVCLMTSEVYPQLRILVAFYNPLVLTKALSSPAQISLLTTGEDFHGATQGLDLLQQRSFKAKPSPCRYGKHVLLRTLPPSIARPTEQQTGAFTGGQYPKPPPQLSCPKINRHRRHHQKLRHPRTPAYLRFLSRSERSHLTLQAYRLFFPVHRIKNRSTATW